MGVLKYIVELFTLLQPADRVRLFWLQVMIIVASLFEVAGVLSIGPFIALAMDPDKLNSVSMYGELFRLTGLESPREFLIFNGSAVLVILILGASLSMITNYRLLMFGERFGAELSSNLFKYYLSKNWLFHTSNHTGTLTNKIAGDCIRVTKYFINPVLMINSRAIVALSLVSLLFIMDPVAALSASVMFVTFYGFLIVILRRRLFRIGEVTTDSYSRRFRALAEGLGGIKDVLALNRQEYFSDIFKQSALVGARAESQSSILGSLPKYAMELLAFGGMIAFILFIIITSGNSLQAIMPSLAMYAFAGFKLMPAFQQIYASATSIRSNVASYISIRGDLLELSASGHEPINPINSIGEFPKLATGLKFEKVSFSYPGQDKPAVKEIEIEIPARSIVGLVGPSGSGKSTLIDLTLGLIHPEDGQLLVDGRALKPEHAPQWRAQLGYVPQSIFLGDVSIKENVAFGLPYDQIDIEKVKRACRHSHLEEFLDSLPEGLETRIGERGVQLSGGQRQRIGIARALYMDPAILILDEATSALDGITEGSIMDSIQDISAERTVLIVAHRLSTVKLCDNIYFVKGGQVVDEGTYESLFERNPQFRRMAQSKLSEDYPNDRIAKRSCGVG